MKLTFPLLLPLVLAPSGPQEPAPQDTPPPGHLRLLEGYHHRRGLGFDSLTGRIWKEDGLEITYDIGGMSGNWAEGVHPTQRAWIRQQTLAGHALTVVETTEGEVRVSFAANEGEATAGGLGTYPANFTAKIGDRADLADLLLMALTYPETGPR